MTTIRGFDFHCHVDLHPDPAVIIQQCERERIAVVAVTTTPKAWPQNYLWTKSSTYVFAAVGLHPELVGERFSEVELLEKRIRDSRFVGEVGLDGSPQHRPNYDKQREVFARTLDASQKHRGRVVTIHSRCATRDVITLIEEHIDPADVLCILHWFSGSAALMQRAIRAGCYFSVNTAMLKHDRGKTLVQSIPQDRLLTETDSPFTEIDDRKTVPWDALTTITQLAKLYGEPDSKMKNIITNNAKCVFQFAGINLEEINVEV